MLYFVYPTSQLVLMLEEFVEAFREAKSNMHGASGLSHCDSVQQWVKEKPWVERKQH